MDGMSVNAEDPRKGRGDRSGRARQVLAARLGRGRTGGSTLLDWLVQCGRAAGRNVAIADGDRRNPTLAGLYPPGAPGGATQPESDETDDVKEWITSLLADMVASRSSLVLDLGGGDRVLSEYGRDLGMVEFCERKGIEALALYVSGPEADDFDHVLAIWQAGYFRATHSVLVLNENLITQGRTAIGAFDSITRRVEMADMASAGVEIVFMPRLPCMGEMRRLGLSFLDAIAGKAGSEGKPLDPVRQFMVETWHNKMVAAFDKVGASGWLP